jgi:hypothetical protein
MITGHEGSNGMAKSKAEKKRGENDKHFYITQHLIKSTIKAYLILK